MNILDCIIQDIMYFRLQNTLDFSVQFKFCITKITKLLEEN